MSPPPRRGQTTLKTWRCLAPWIAVLLPLAVGLVLRGIGIRHGAPRAILHPDVAKQAHVAVDIYHGNLDLRRRFQDDVRFTLYPYGTSALVGQTARAARTLQGLPAGDAPHLWRWDYRLRLLGVGMLLGATGLLLCCRLRAWGPTITGVVGLLLLTEPISAQHSHYGMNDVPLLATLLVAWVAAGRLARGTRTFAWALLCGLALGLGFGIKYQAALGAVFPLAALGLLAAQRRWGLLIRAGAAVAAAGLIGVFLTTPLLVQDPLYLAAHFTEFLHWQTRILGLDAPWTESLLRNSRTVLHHLLGGGHVLLLAVVPALVGLGWRQRRHADPETVMLAGSALAFVLLLLAPILLMRDVVRETDLIPVFAFLILGAGFVLQALRGPQATPAPARFVVACIAMAAAAVLGSGSALRDSLALRRPDTQLRAQAWAHQALPQGARVLREHYTLPTGRADLRERSYRNFATNTGREEMRSGTADVLVASSLAHARFFDANSVYYSPAFQEEYRHLHTHYRLVAIFRDRPMTFSHPRILVYANPDTAAGRALIALTAKK